ncbi:hypothetical protein [Citromicrobium bathyomarinum]|uniref:hypothetical protein n=1 Tax=Citromicrobium bathyomarinum TaxID=72174 RepID=UPI00315A2FF8
MPIYEPQIALSEVDRELLELLGQLLLSQHCLGHNMPAVNVPLSLAEANRLLYLLESFVESRYFREAAYFIEGMANGDAWSNDNLREIYLSWRKYKGRSRAMSSRHWNEFVVRAGFNSSENSAIYAGGFRQAPVRPMPLEHFVKMEAKLAGSANIHPRVTQLILELVTEASPKITALRKSKGGLKKDSVWTGVRNLADKISEVARGLERHPVSKFELVAITTTVLDASAMYTTRDWTATGVLSNLAAVSLQSLDFRAWPNS